ncbi:MAG: ElyC/SanA/YdcF family protein [Cyanobacteria bacterium P01_F01_bin.86]
MSALTWVLLGIDGLVLLMLLSLAIFFRYFLYSFLACNHPVDSAAILVVEGWLEELSLEGAIAEFKRGDYQYLVTVGGPIRLGLLLSEYQTIAEVAAATLVSLGFDADKLVVVSSAKTTKNRTVATAIAFRDWLSKNHATIRSINLYSNNVHARRSYLIYRQYLTSDIQLGVISSKSRGHSPNTWWHSSTGLKVTLMEFIAYCYVLYGLLRHPSKPTID